MDVDIAAQALWVGGRRAALVVANDVTSLKAAQAALAKSTQRLRVLHEIDRGMIAAAEPVTIAEAALRPLRDLLGVPRAIVSLFEFEAGEVEWLAAIGRRRLHAGPGVRYPMKLAGDVEALRRGEMQVIDVDALPDSPEAQALLASGVHVYMVVPMLARGELIGSLSFGGARGQFSEEQIEIAQEAAAQLAIAITQARLYEQVKRYSEELEQRVRERTHELAEAKAEADRANRAKSDFLSRMSHELRTPLNAILGFGQLLQMQPDGGPDHESVEQILKGGRHLLELINEVLDISRIEAGRLSLSQEPVQIGEAVARVVDLARPLAAERRIDVQVSGGTLHHRHVLADTQRLQQVLLNLVSNAIKYNHEGGRLAQVPGPLHRGHPVAPAARGPRPGGAGRDPLHPRHAGAARAVAGARASARPDPRGPPPPGHLRRGRVARDQERSAPRAHAGDRAQRRRDAGTGAAHGGRGRARVPDEAARRAAAPHAHRPDAAGRMTKPCDLDELRRVVGRVMAAPPAP